MWILYAFDTHEVKMPVKNLASKNLEISYPHIERYDFYTMLFNSSQVYKLLSVFF